MKTKEKEIESKPTTDTAGLEQTSIPATVGRKPLPVQLPKAKPAAPKAVAPKAEAAEAAKEKPGKKRITTEEVLKTTTETEETIREVKPLIPEGQREKKPEGRKLSPRKETLTPRQDKKSPPPASQGGNWWKRNWWWILIALAIIGGLIWFTNWALDQRKAGKGFAGTGSLFGKIPAMGTQNTSGTGDNSAQTDAPSTGAGGSQGGGLGKMQSTGGRNGIEGSFNGSFNGSNNSNTIDQKTYIFNNYYPTVNNGGSSPTKQVAPQSPKPTTASGVPASWPAKGQHFKLYPTPERAKIKITIEVNTWCTFKVYGPWTANVVVFGPPSSFEKALDGVQVDKNNLNAHHDDVELEGFLNTGSCALVVEITCVPRK